MKTRLNREEISKLKRIAQQKDYDAIVALLDYRLTQVLDTLTETATDHRYIQGKYQALKSFRGDIVRELK